MHSYEQRSDAGAGGSHAGMRGVPRDRPAMGAPAQMSRVRPRRLLYESIGKHATKHANTAGHKVIRSFEPKENWRYCYFDGSFAD